MQEELHISIIQTELFWEDPTKNREHFTKLISGIQNSPDIIVLPETFTTGFSMKKEVAEPIQSNGGNETIEWLKKMAEQKQSAIAGSCFVNEDGQCYNRLYFVEPNGKITFYNKRHLFCLTKEDEFFTAGDQQVVVDYKGWKISLMVCYDLRFPVWMRRTLKHDYDVILLVSNWPEKRSFAWKSLLVARAIENQSYVIGSNRIGKDGTEIPYSGDSAMIDPMGEYIVAAEAGKDLILNGKVQFSKLEAIRKALPFYLDADKFSW